MGVEFLFSTKADGVTVDEVYSLCHNYLENSPDVIQPLHFDSQLRQLNLISSILLGVDMSFSIMLRDLNSSFPFFGHWCSFDVIKNCGVKRFLILL